MTVHRVPITYDAAPGGSVNAYLVVEEHIVLVDAPERHPDLDALLNEHGLDAVVATHHHPDHAAGIGTYAREYDARRTVEPVGRLPSPTLPGLSRTRRSEPEVTSPTR